MIQNEQKTDPGKRYTLASRGGHFARVFNAFVYSQLELNHRTRRGHIVAVQSLRFTPGSSIGATKNPRTVGELTQDANLQNPGSGDTYAPVGIMHSVKH